MVRGGKSAVNLHSIIRGKSDIKDYFGFINVFDR